jgi:hypothetical protein
LNPGRRARGSALALGYKYFTPLGLSVCGFADSQNSSFIWQMDDPFKRFNVSTI